MGLSTDKKEKEESLITLEEKFESVKTNYEDSVKKLNDLRLKGREIHVRTGQLEVEMENLKSKLIMQIHDELLLEVHQDEIDYISKMVIEHMRNAMKLDVPIEIDFGIGPSWYEAH